MDVMISPILYWFFFVGLLGYYWLCRDLSKWFLSGFRCDLV